MATLRWIGNAQPVAGVFQATIDDYDDGTLYEIFIFGVGTKSMGVAGQGSNTATAAALVAALSAGAAPAEFLDASWSNPSPNVIQGVGAPGVLFRPSIQASGGTGTVLQNTPAVATGPNFWDNVDNWDAGSVPGSGDTVYIDNSSVSILYNIEQQTFAPALISIGANFTGQIGLPQYNSENSSGTYSEYRPTALEIATAALEIGNGSGAGSSLIRINTSTAACAAIVYSTGSPSGSGAESGVPAVVLDMDNTAATLQVLDGSVGVGVVSKAVDVIGTLSIGQATEQASLGPASFASSGSSSTSVAVGPNVVINSAINVSGGSLLIDSTGDRSLGTSINVYGGTLEVIGAAGITNLNVYSGTCYWSSTGTITSALVGPGGTLDFSQDLQAKTLTNPVQMSAGATLNDPFSVVSSLAIKAVNCTLAQVTVSLGFNHTFTRT